MADNELIRIAGGTVYDPANGVDGDVRDIWIKGGKIVPAPDGVGTREGVGTLFRLDSVAPKTEPLVEKESRPRGMRPPAVRTIDASGLVVMPGGVDMHCHIAGPKVNAARRMCSDLLEKGSGLFFDSRPSPAGNASSRKRVPTPFLRSGTMGSVPSTFATGYKYAGMGYTTAFDAAIPPLLARHAHEEFDDTPCIDKGFYVLMGNNHYVMQSIQRATSREKLKAFIGWLLGGGQGVCAEARQSRRRRSLEAARRAATCTGSTTRSTISTSRRGRSSAGVAQAANELRLPHPVHIHCNNLGMPGNWTTTLETMKALEGHRGHITHIQFHSYGGGDGDENTFNSKVVPLAEYVNAHPNITVDVGQVMFGETTSMTGDGPLGLLPAQHLQGQVVLERHRDGIRLRHRADQIPEQDPGPLAAMGDRAGVVSAGRGSVAGGDEHRPSQRRLVPGLPADHPPADGPHLSRATCSRRARRRCAKRSTLADLDREYTLERDRHHHAGRPGANPGPQEQGPPRPRRRRRHHDLHAAREQGDDVRAAADRDQGGPK